MGEEGLPQRGIWSSQDWFIHVQGADYTSMGSFGNAESFGENLVASLDRSFLLRSGFNRPKSVQVTTAVRVTLVNFPEVGGFAHESDIGSSSAVSRRGTSSCSQFPRLKHRGAYGQQAEICRQACA